uniref:Zinc finger GRF-type domain-containing protein n=1 Tax=Lactuca sativa TaxID=4236 RepID=A0A9R1V827_LACSA|nr:hypothetical protein LSAT_V11C600341180 [Lactuca sativa]
MIDIKCNCGATVVIRTSYSKRNPGKLYYACTVKFIGWVNDYDQDCDCMAFRMKLEEQNRKLKLYLVISWFFLFQSLYIKCRFSNEVVSILVCVFCNVICINKKNFNFSYNILCNHNVVLSVGVQI